MKWLAGVFIERLLKVLLDAFQDWWERQRAAKKAKKKIKEIQEETKDDPKARARRIADMLKR